MSFFVKLNHILYSFEVDVLFDGYSRGAFENLVKVSVRIMKVVRYVLNCKIFNRHIVDIVNNILRNTVKRMKGFIFIDCAEYVQQFYNFALDDGISILIMPSQ